MGYGGAANAAKEVEALRLFLQSALTSYAHYSCNVALLRMRPTDRLMITEGYAPNGPWQYDCVDLTRQVP